MQMQVDSVHVTLLEVLPVLFDMLMVYVIRSAASAVRYADGINNIDDCFSKFINADMIEMIVLRSNTKINSYLENHSDKVGHHKYPFLRITDFIEIRALIGLIFFRGLGSIIIKWTYYFLQKLVIQYLEQQWDVIVLNYF